MVNQSLKTNQSQHAKRSIPKYKLSKEEIEGIIAVVKKEEFTDLPSTQIIPKLADQGTDIASQSILYRVLREKSPEQ